MSRRVAVTGVGVVAPGGIGTKAFWSMLSTGRTATGPITLFDATNFRSRIAAECDFDARSEGLTPTLIRRLDRHIQFALVAAREAVGDANLEIDEEASGRVGVTMGTAVGSTIRLEDEYVVASDGGRHWLPDAAHTLPFLDQSLVASTLAAEVAADVGAAGPAMTVSTGCTSGLDSIGYAFQLIEDGAADVMVAGASDAPISPISVACFDAIRATSARNDDPEHASRPFDAGRDGFVIAEGAAVLVLEDLDRARARGAQVYCEVGGFATRGNAYHMTGLTREGVEMSAAINDALRQARVAPQEIGYVNAHGSGTKQNDRHETAAVKRSLGRSAYGTPMSSIKSMVGHSLGAIGAIELVACVLAMQNKLLPPTANYETPDPECDLDYIPNVARERAVSAVLSVGSGFGGFQSAVVLDRLGRR